MTPIPQVPAPQGQNKNPRSTPSYEPISMNWYILEAVQNSRILSVGATPVLLFTSFLTPFVELLNGATQASRNLVNFQFTRSRKSLTSAFWYTIANVPMGIIAVATTPFDKGRCARNSYSESMKPPHARNPYLPTQVIDKDAIQRELKREAELKEQVATLRDLLPPEQGKELDLQLGYEAQFAKALELIQERVLELAFDADPKNLQNACNDIYEKATNTLWNLLTEEQKNEVNNRFPSDNLKAKYERVCQLIRNALGVKDDKYNKHIANTLNFIATLAGIQTIDVNSNSKKRGELFHQLKEKLSEKEKEEFKTKQDLASRIEYLFLKLSAAALTKAGNDAAAPVKKDLAALEKTLRDRLKLLEETQADLKKTQEILSQKIVLIKEKENELDQFRAHNLERTEWSEAAEKRHKERQDQLNTAEKQLKDTQDQLNAVQKNYIKEKNEFEKFQLAFPPDAKLLVSKVQDLEVQHEQTLNNLKSEHENAIKRLEQTIEEKEKLIKKGQDKTLELTNAIKEQEKRIKAQEESHTVETEKLKNQNLEKIENQNLVQKTALKIVEDSKARLEQLYENKIKELTHEHQVVQAEAVKNKEIELTKQFEDKTNQSATTIQEQKEEIERLKEQLAQVQR